LGANEKKSPSIGGINYCTCTPERKYRWSPGPLSSALKASEAEVTYCTVLYCTISTLSVLSVLSINQSINQSISRLYPEVLVLVTAACSPSPRDIPVPPSPCSHVPRMLLCLSLSCPWLVLELYSVSRTGRLKIRASQVQVSCIFVGGGRGCRCGASIKRRSTYLHKGRAVSFHEKQGYR